MSTHNSTRRRVVMAVILGLLLVSLGALTASADSQVIDFESYTVGNINGQDGWIKTNANFDAAIVNQSTFGLAYPAFGSRSLRISNAYTVGSFGDQTFSKPLVDEAGETSAANNGMSGGTRQPYYEATFDFASTVPGAEQPGLMVGVSPDRGDGARMSLFRLYDKPAGLEVEFYDFDQTRPGTCVDGLDFQPATVATGLARNAVHNVRITMNFIDGVNNDVVKVYVDGGLVHTGTSWEDYFRDCEPNPTRTVDSLLFRASGTAAPATSGNGFLIDNVSQYSGPEPCTTTCYVDDAAGSDSNGGTSPSDAFLTIQKALDTVQPGGTVRVLPGDYSETASDRLVLEGTPHQEGPYVFGLFMEKDGVTLQGVTAADVAITDPTLTEALIETNSTAGFGPDGIFVQGDNITIAGVEIGTNCCGQNKTIEIIGDGFTLKDNFVSDQWGSIYFGDWQFDTDTNTSHIQSYTIDNNDFADGVSVDLANGTGLTGPIAGRTITDNEFTFSAGEYWATISFTGSGTGVEWFIHSVGGAIITGNTFHNTDHGAEIWIRARGDYDNAQFNWQSYWDDNTFDTAVMFGSNPPTVPGEYSYSSGSYTFNHVRRIGAMIQPEVDHAAAGDTVLIAPGSYPENVVVDKALTLTGAGDGTNPAVDTILEGTDLSGVGIFINSGITDVTIEELRVQNYTGASSSGIWGDGSNSDFVARNLTVHNNGNGSVAGGGIRLSAGGGIDNVLITGNTLSNNTGRGFVIWDGYKTNITITNNTVTGNNCCGIELQDGTASGVTMTGNTVTGNVDSGMSAVGLMAGAGPNVIANNTLTNNGRFGIEIKLPNGTGQTSGDGSIVVENNTVTLTVPKVDLRDFAGIAAFRRGWVSGYNNVDIPTGVVIRNNTVSGYQQSSTSDGFGIVVEGTNMHVSGNTLNNNDVGVQVQAGHTPYVANTGTNGDQEFQGDLYFGRGNSPVGCAVIGSNTFSGNTVNTRNVNAGGGVVTNVNTSETFCSIQAAINDAQTLNGHVIEASAGTYVETVAVNKEVTIRGADPTTTIIDPPPSGNALNITVGNVTIEDLKITDAAQGARLSGAIANITFDNVHFVNNTSRGIEMQNGATLLISNVQVLNSLFDNNVVGVRMSSTTRVDGVLIENTTFQNHTGSGFNQANDNAAGWVKNLTVKDSTFTNNGTTSGHAGVYAEEFSNVLIEESTFTGNLFGINLFDYYSTAASVTTNVTIRNNTFTDHKSTTIALKSATSDPNAQLFLIEDNTITQNVGALVGAAQAHLAVTLSSSTVNGAVDVVDNTLTFSGTFPTGILATYGIYLAGGAQDVRVENNAIDGGNVGTNGAAIPSSGIRIVTSTFQTNADIVATKNTINNFVNGVVIHNGSNVPGGVQATSVVQIIRNNLSANSAYGIQSGPAVDSDGTCNWWGNASGPAGVGPGTGSPVSVNVDYTPWLFSNDLDGACYTPGTITVVKQTTPEGDTTLFEFDPSWGANFTLADNGSASSGPLAPGNYSVAEVNIPAGYVATGSSCTNGVATVAPSAITLGDGENWTCTFNNAKQGSITVAKETTPNGDPTLFTFNPSWSATDFTLSDGQNHSSGPLAAGSYDVAEAGNPAWVLTSATCDNAATVPVETVNPAAITVANGDAWTCTFNNAKKGTITVAKETTPNGDPTLFTFNPSWSATDFTLSDGQNHSSGPLTAGSYSVVETVNPAYALTSASCVNGAATADPSSITVANGDAWVCTFNNAKKGTITVTKQTLPDGDPTLFTFDPSWSASNFSLSDGQSASSGPLTAGSFNVAEINIPAGWALTNATCANGLATADPSSITVANGDAWVCTFTNTKQGTVTVIKQTLPDADPTVFEFNQSWAGPNILLSDGQSANSGPLAAGTYSVAEVNIPSAWVLTNASCANGAATADPSSITVANGDAWVCTFTNAKKGTISVIKQTTPDGDPTLFSFDPSWSASNFTLSDGQSASSGPLAAGSYSVVELAAPANWTLSSASCTNGVTTVAPNAIVLANNEAWTCTFNNTYDPPGDGNLYIAPNRNNGVVGGVAYMDEDIVVNALGTNSWAMYFDGSDVGITKNLTDFTFTPDGCMLMTFNGNQNVPGVGLVKPQDLVKFCATQTGTTTAGTFTMYFDGSDVGLAAGGEIIDAVEVRPNGDLVISTKGTANSPQPPAAPVKAKKNDLLIFHGTQYGPTTMGTWDVFFSNQLVTGLTKENIISLYIDGAQVKYVSFWDGYNVGGVIGDANDILIIHPNNTVTKFWEGSDWGYTGRVHGLHIVP